MSVTTAPGARTAPPSAAGGSSRLWLPVVVLAALLALVDGFWLTSLRGAIGAVERAQGPFAAWWHDSALALPFFLAAVVLPLARPWRARWRGVPVTGLLVVGSSTLVGVGWAALEAVRDYQLQVALLQERVALHAVGAHAHAGHALSAAQLVHERHATFATHVLGLEQAAGVLLVSNLLVVAWFAAARGGRLLA